MSRKLKTIQFFIVALFMAFAWGEVAAQTISGTVFEDADGNGKMGAEEDGIPGVAVSNQVEVVLTDAQGHYQLPVRDPMIVFVVKPAGYQVPLDHNNLPRFYYIHQTTGSPQGLSYAGLSPTGKLPSQVNFPLKRTEVKKEFRAIVVGDPQPRNQQEVSYYRDDIVTGMVDKDVSFYMALGDMAFDDLNIYGQYNRAVGKIGVPAYNVHGNHDMNYKSEGDEYAAETFKRVFGPPYYSFNYGRVHFVVLDDVGYRGWNEEKKQNGGYRGYISEKQGMWLKNDLKHVPEENLLVLSMHIPIFTRDSESEAMNVVNRGALFSVLEERSHVLALSAHTHFVEHLRFTQENGWHGKGLFYSINAGAGCGAWWSGPKDPRGIPESMCMDGGPNGYYILTFSGSRFNYYYYPARLKNDYQLRISSPRGIISPDQAKKSGIVVNVFNGEPQTKVFFTLEGGKERRMQRRRMADPFVSLYLKENPDKFPDWADTPVECNHIWVAPLPARLKEGTHCIRVRARDSWDNTYSGVKLFEIKEDGSPEK